MLCVCSSGASDIRQADVRDAVGGLRVSIGWCGQEAKDMGT